MRCKKIRKIKGIRYKGVVGVFKFLKGVKSEINKVTWITAREVVNRFLWVLGVAVSMLVYFWVIDFIINLISGK